MRWKRTEADDQVGVCPVDESRSVVGKRCVNVWGLKQLKGGRTSRRAGLKVRTVFMLRLQSKCEAEKEKSITPLLTFWKELVHVSRATRSAALVYGKGASPRSLSYCTDCKISVGQRLPVNALICFHNCAHRFA